MRSRKSDGRKPASQRGSSGTPDDGAESDPGIELGRSPEATPEQARSSWLAIIDAEPGTCQTKIWKYLDLAQGLLPAYADACIRALESGGELEDGGRFEGAWPSIQETVLIRMPKALATALTLAPSDAVRHTVELRLRPVRDWALQVVESVRGLSPQQFISPCRTRIRYGPWCRLQESLRALMFEGHALIAEINRVEAARSNGVARPEGESPLRKKPRKHVPPPEPCVLAVHEAVLRRLDTVGRPVKINQLVTSLSDHRTAAVHNAVADLHAWEFVYRPPGGRKGVTLRDRGREYLRAASQNCAQIATKLRNNSRM